MRRGLQTVDKYHIIRILLYTYTMQKIKLSRWSKENDISYQAAYRQYKAGVFPEPIWVSPTNRLYVLVNSNANGSQTAGHAQENPYVLYARVSGADQKEALERQMERLRLYAASKGYRVHAEYAEIGSGLNGQRSKLKSILKGSCHILVEHKDRLARFGFEYIQAALEAQNRKLQVINETEATMDLVQDFVDVCTSMCARIYGKRGAKERAKKMIQVSQEHLVMDGKEQVKKYK